MTREGGGTVGHTVGSLEVFVDEVVPELQRCGVFHEEYRGRTLRDDLGIPRPANRYEHLEVST